MSIDRVKDLKKEVFLKEAVKEQHSRLNLKVLSGCSDKWCRKSTVLNMIARRIEKTSRDITLDGVDLHMEQQARCMGVYLSSS